MNKIKYIFLLIIAILFSLTFYFLTQMSKKQEVKKETQTQIDYVTFNIKYDINLKDKNLLPSKFLNKFNDKESKTFLDKNNLNYLLDNFTVDENKNIIKNKNIYFFPKENVEVIKTHHKNLNINFFTSRKIKTELAIKSVNILNDNSLDFNECMEALKKIYKGSYNEEFFKKALPKLIY